MWNRRREELFCFCVFGLKALLGDDAVVPGQPQDGIVRFSLQDTNRRLQLETLHPTLAQQGGAVSTVGVASEATVALQSPDEYSLTILRMAPQMA